MTIYPAGGNPRPNFQFIQVYDGVIWGLVLLFFSGSALLSAGNVFWALIGAAGIVVIMFLVSASVEVIIEVIKDIKGLGTMVGFITNGPEALCLIVGLIAGDVLFAASTPLGSNVMNPLLLLAAAGLTGNLLVTAGTHTRYTAPCILLTAFLAVVFFFFPEEGYPLWLAGALVISIVLFFRRPPEPAGEKSADRSISTAWFLPAMAVLVAAGYFLDPVVSFTAGHSNSPKGIIGFFVLATLTSWPEFKSTLSLLRRGKPLAAVLNITVSNITNIWLAVIGVFIHML